MKKRYMGLVVCLVTLILIPVLLIEACSKPAPSPSPSPAKPAPTTSAPAKSSPTAATQAPTTKPAPAASPQAKVIEIKFHSFTPANHPLYVYVVGAWLDEFEKRAAGKVKVVRFFSNTLAKMEENYDATVKRISDMSLGVQTYMQGRFSLSELIYLPGLGLPSAQASALALMDIYNTFPEVRKQYEDTRVIFLVGNPPRVIGTKQKAIRTLDDMKGVKMWVTGKIASDMIKTLGATPVTMPPSDVYGSMEKGIVDGAAWPANSLVGNRITELLKYITDVPLDVGTEYFVMNKDVYNGLPADVKKIVDDMSGDWGFKFAGEQFNKADGLQWDIVRKSSGIEIIKPPAAEIARWSKAVEPVAEAQVADLEAKGLPARKVYQELLKFSQQYQK